MEGGLMMWGSNHAFKRRDATDEQRVARAIDKALSAKLRVTLNPYDPAHVALANEALLDAARAAISALND